MESGWGGELHRSPTVTMLSEYEKPSDASPSTQYHQNLASHRCGQVENMPCRHHRMAERAPDVASDV